IIDQGVLGKIRYLYSRRSGPGPVRNDINVAWNLAPHDVSLANYLLGRLPLSVSAQGGSFLLPKIEDVVDMALDYGENKTFFHLSWIEPRKVREVTVVGELGTAIFDDTVAEKLRIFTKENPQGQAVFSGKVDALRDQCLHFSECMRERKQPITDAKEGYENVFILERTAESLASGESVKLFGDRG
ncbi:MAG: gfo/Idh/MocA family oxidoreductase, partial [Candidatus Vogelbacteria bacterium]|nr:gfo/Idh/MocA family oxidoreductase [Candidatus Vogelbacteria bacterium]